MATAAIEYLAMSSAPSAREVARGLVHLLAVSLLAWALWECMAWALWEWLKWLKWLNRSG